MVLKPPFRGFMAPVFTPFENNGDLNTSEIPKYAAYLARKKVKAVLVNGTVGEGVLMFPEERKRVAEAWVAAAKTNDLQVMIHVGGTMLPLVLDLAQHAESLGVSSILCLPDLFFRPKKVKDLVEYLQLVSCAAPKTPLFYYHYPTLTGVKLDMVEFLETGYEMIPTLAGIKHTSVDLEEGYRCLQVNARVFNVFLGCDQLIAPGLLMGFDSFIPTALNYAPDKVFNINEFLENGRTVAAGIIQGRIFDLCTFVQKNMHWNNGFKEVTCSITGLKLGTPREPIGSLDPEQGKMLKEMMNNEYWVRSIDTSA